MSIGLSQLLILGAIAVFALYVFGPRTTLTDRMVYIILVITGMILALYPELSTRVANSIGIGRGVDLLLYVFVLFSLFHYAGVASRMKGMEQRITLLVRANAIEHAMKGMGYPEDGQERDTGTTNSDGNPRVRQSGIDGL